MSNGFEIVPAARTSVPMLISVSGVSGSGKTYSALLLAAGLAGPNGKVTLIDTENGRGAMYADSPGIRAALPKGYFRIPFDAPFTPARYVAAISAAQAAGTNVCIVDSGSHEWEGDGGCCDIAESNKLRGLPNWSKAKIEHKKFANYCLASPMHLIFCLRARDKVKIVATKGGKVVGRPQLVTDADGERLQAGESGDTQVVPIGIQPIAEKSFVFEMLLSLQIEESTHFARPVKVPEPLLHLFQGSTMLTARDGDNIRKWNDTGAAGDPTERILKLARAEAERGTEQYRAYYAALSKDQKLALRPWHDECKKIADLADQLAARNSIPAFGSPDDPVEWPDTFDGPELIWNGKHLRFNEDSGNYVLEEAQ